MPKPKTVVTAERDAERARLYFPGMKCSDGSRTCSRPDFPLARYAKHNGLILRQIYAAPGLTFCQTGSKKQEQ